MQSAIAAGDLPVVFDHFNPLFGGRLDSACGRDPAHVYNMPACPAGSESLYTFTEHNGAWVDAAVICNSSRPSIPLTVTVPMPMPVAAAVPVVVQLPVLVVTVPVPAVASITQGESGKFSFGVGVAEGLRRHELTTRVGRFL